MPVRRARPHAVPGDAHPDAPRLADGRRRARHRAPPARPRSARATSSSATTPTPAAARTCPTSCMVEPIFVDGELVAWATNIAHHADFVDRGHAHIYQEGLRIPPVRLYREGELQQDVLDLDPAQLPGAARAPQRPARADGGQPPGHPALPGAVPASYGKALVLAAGDALLDYTERLTRAGIAHDSRRASTRSRTASTPTRSPTRRSSRTRIEVKDGEISLHFDSPPQVRAGINLVWTGLLATVYYAMKTLVGPDIPANAGLFRPIHVSAPEGHDAELRRRPAAVNSRTQTCQRVVDLIHGALAPAMPERIIAACNGACVSSTFSGVNPRTGQFYVYLETIGGGFGARATKDGLDGVHVHITNTSNLPGRGAGAGVSAGRGALRAGRRLRRRRARWRGGLGIVREIRAEDHECHAFVHAARRRSAPWGLFGGHDGGRARIEYGAGVEPPVRAQGVPQAGPVGGDRHAGRRRLRRPARARPRARAPRPRGRRDLARGRARRLRIRRDRRGAERRSNRSRSSRRKERLHMAETADVVVIGGGVIGTSIAFALAVRGRQARHAPRKGRARQRRLGALERAHPHALRQRGRRAPGVGELSPLPRLGRAHGRAARLHPHGLRGRGRPRGRGGAARERGDAARDRRRHRRRSRRRSSRRSSRSSTWTTSAPPPTSRPAATRARPTWWKAFAARRRSCGARIRQWTPVQRIVRRESAVVGVETPRAASTPAPWWWPRARGRRGSAARSASSCPRGPRRSTPCWSRARPRWPSRTWSFIDHVLGTYFRPESDVLTLVGVPCQVWDIDPDTMPTGLPPHAPGGGRADAHPSHARHGARELARGYRAFDCYSADRHAILGAVRGIDGLYLATAFSGSGFKIAPAVGTCLAELITEGRATTVDISAVPARSASPRASPSRAGIRISRAAITWSPRADGMALYVVAPPAASDPTAHRHLASRASCSCGWRPAAPWPCTRRTRT